MSEKRLDVKKLKEMLEDEWWCNRIDVEVAVTDKGDLQKLALVAERLNGTRRTLWVWDDFLETTPSKEAA